jgi:hypothetical protein
LRTQRHQQVNEEAVRKQETCDRRMVATEAAAQTGTQAHTCTPSNLEQATPAAGVRKRLGDFTGAGKETQKNV